MPPSSAGTARPRSPASASVDQSGRSSTARSAPSRFSRSGPTSFSRMPRARSRTVVCSSPKRKSTSASRRTEHGELHLVVDLLEAQRDGHADADVRRRAPDEVRDDAGPLVELDERAHERILVARELRMVEHGMAVDLARALRADRRPFDRLALAAHRARRMPERAAALALLDQELAACDRLPPPAVVVADDGTHASRRRRRGGSGGGSGLRLLMGAELEHPERHPADLFAALVAEDVAGVDEVTDAEGGGLLLRDRLD